MKTKSNKVEGKMESEEGIERRKNELIIMVLSGAEK